MDKISVKFLQLACILIQIYGFFLTKIEESVTEKNNEKFNNKFTDKN